MMDSDQGPAETRTANGTRHGLVPNAMGWVAAAAIGAIMDDRRRQAARGCHAQRAAPCPGGPGTRRASRGTRSGAEGVFRRLKRHRLVRAARGRNRAS